MQVEHIIIAALITGGVSYWVGYFTRKSAEQPAYSRAESDAVFHGLGDRMDRSDERLERIESKVDLILQNGRGHAS